MNWQFCHFQINILKCAETLRTQIAENTNIREINIKHDLFFKKIDFFQNLHEDSLDVIF